MRELRANATQILPLISGEGNSGSRALAVRHDQGEAEGVCRREDRTRRRSTGRTCSRRCETARARRSATPGSDAEQCRFHQESDGTLDARVMAFFTEDVLTGPNGKVISERCGEPPRRDSQIGRGAQKRASAGCRSR